MPTRENIKKFQYSDSIHRSVWDKRYQQEEFEVGPVTSKIGGGAAGGTAGDENLLMTPKTCLQYHILGTQTITAPTAVAAGLDLGSMDATNTDGLEINTGVLTNNPFAWKVGEDAAFFIRIRATITTVAGTDDFAIGFRKQEANQANVDDYADMAAINIIAGDIKTETIVGGAATVTTDTTDNWADAESKWIEVQVSSAGVVSYKIDNAEPTTVVDYTFTDALTLIPFVYFMENATTAGSLPITWECGFVE
jgi:hypothetical protein